MTISFNSIPVDMRTPGQYLEVDTSRAVQGLPVKRHRVLLIAQKATGSNNALRRMDSITELEGQYSAYSLLCSMARAFREANSYTELWTVGLSATGGTAATGSITFAGTATESGVLKLRIAGYLVQATVSLGDTAAAVANKVRNAVQSIRTLYVEATVLGSVVTLNVEGAGEWGNSVDVRLGYDSPSSGGLIAGITQTIVPMSGGTGNTSVAPGLTAAGDQQFDTVVIPYTDSANLALLEAWLAERFGPMRQLEGQGYVGISGALATATALGDGRNSPHLTVVDAGYSPTPPWVWAVQAAAVDAYESDPARPRQGLLLPSCLPASVVQQRTRDERNVLLYSGISTHKVSLGGQVYVERLVTTYKSNFYGAPDTSLLNIETLRTLAYLRWTLRNRIATKYPRHKLANDGTLYSPGQAMVTPSVIRSELLALFREWEYAGLVENFDQFKTDLIVERSSTDPDRVDAVIPPDTVNQFRTFAGLVQFRL